MALADKNTVGSSLPPFFNHKEHLGDLAIIFEPKSFRVGKSKYIDQKTGEKKDQTNVATHVTVFRTQSALDRGEPDFAGLVTINAGSIPKDLVELMEKSAAKGDNSPAIIKVIKMVPTKSGNDTAVLRDAAEDDYNKAVAYYEAREAKLAKALDDVPDF